MKLIYQKLTGWKYRVHVEHRFDLDFCPVLLPPHIREGWIGEVSRVYEDAFLRIEETGSFSGLLTVKPGYAWDGTSGPTIDTKNTMRGGLAHDALCQLRRMGVIADGCLPAINKYFHKVLMEDGMSRIRAWYYWKGGSLGASFQKAGEPNKHEDEVLEAP